MWHDRLMSGLEQSDGVVHCPSTEMGQICERSRMVIMKMLSTVCDFSKTDRFTSCLVPPSDGFAHCL